MNPDKRQGKREAILDAAFSLFLEKGYTNTKISEIAKVAGIGKGTVYEYFDSKESLVVDIVNTRIMEELKLTEAAVGEKETLSEKLLAYLLAQQAFVEKYQNATKHNIPSLLKDLFQSGDFLSETILCAMQSVIKFQFQIVRQILEKAVQNGELRPLNINLATTCLMGAFETYTSARQTSTIPPCLDLQELQFDAEAESWAEEHFISLLLNGLLAQSAENTATS